MKKLTDIIFDNHVLHGPCRIGTEILKHMLFLKKIKQSRQWLYYNYRLLDFTYKDGAFFQKTFQVILKLRPFRIFKALYCGKLDPILL